MDATFIVISFTIVFIASVNIKTLKSFVDKNFK